MTDNQGTRSVARRARFGSIAILAIAVIVALTGCGSSDSNKSGGAKKVTLGVVDGSIDILPVDVAVDEGFFKDEGLNISFDSLTGGGAAYLAGLSSGSIDATVMTLSQAAAARDKGIGTQIVAGTASKLTYSLVVPSKSDVPTAGTGPNDWQATLRALKGKTIGDIAAGGAVDQAIKWVFSQAGVNPKDGTFITTGAGSSEVAALTSGRVAAIFATAASAQELASTGKGRIVFDPTKSGPESLRIMGWAGMAVSTKYLAANPDVAKKLFNAVSRAVAFMREPNNYAKVAKIAAKHKNVVGSGFRELLERYNSSIYSATITPSSAEAAITIGKAAGTIPASSSVTPTEMVNSVALGAG